MKKIIQISLIIAVIFIFQNCSSTKVLNTWKAEQSVVDLFKTKNILVIARTANNQARIAFETEIAKELRLRGLNATESFIKAPKIYPNKKMTEERMKFIKNLMNSEGFDAVVLTVVKDKQEIARTSKSRIHIEGSYLNSYPGYNDGFYNYYSQPYVYGPGYVSFDEYNPSENTTYIEKKYALETVAFNLNEPTEKQLVAIVTTNLNDPKESYKTADKYVKLIMKHLEEK